jgi:hypothetical protein
MITRSAITFALCASLLAVPALQAQDAPPAQPAKTPPAKAPAAKAAKPLSAKDLNLNEYVELLRSNVRQEKSQMMGAVMQLSAADAAKFWPIYAEYDAELTKVNDLRVANIEDYAKFYTNMTDDKADELVKNAMQFQKQRNELLFTYYGKMKDALGSITAARFLQVENQLLMIIDLQVAASLPIVGQPQ